MSLQSNITALCFCLIWADYCIIVSGQQQRTFPIRLPASIRQSCPSQDDINTEHNIARRLIEGRLRSVPCSCEDDGWRRVAFLNMSDPNESCPSNWNLTTSPVRGCGRSSGNGTTCDSVVYPVNGQAYSSVCGRILAYHRGGAAGFGAIPDHSQNSLEQAYVSGVSVTYGPAGARQHIWTFAGTLNEDNRSYRHYNCPCSDTNVTVPSQIPSFVGSDYFCDTGNRGPGWSATTVYQSDPLWDGEGCGPFSTCCNFNSPYFSKTLDRPVIEDIELRLCSYGYNSEEDKIISLIDICVQ